MYLLINHFVTVIIMYYSNHKTKNNEDYVRTHARRERETERERERDARAYMAHAHNTLTHADTVYHPSGTRAPHVHTSTLTFATHTHTHIIAPHAPSNPSTHI